MDGVAGWFERRGEIPLAIPPGFREYGPISDDPERAEPEVDSQAIGGLSFGLEYCDLRGWVSTRTIRCSGTTVGAQTDLRAYCHLRAAPRTFRFDRIISITHLRTGHILSALEHASLLAPFIPGADLDGRGSAVRGAQAVSRDGVHALLQLSMPQGRLEDRARDIILAYAIAEAGADATAISAELALWIEHLSPTLAAVIASIDRVLLEKDKFVRLLPYLLKVVRSRGNIAEQEESVRAFIEDVRLHYRRKLLDRPLRMRAIG